MSTDSAQAEPLGRDLNSSLTITAAMVAPHPEAPEAVPMLSVSQPANACTPDMATSQIAAPVRKRRMYPKNGPKFDAAAWCRQAALVGYRFSVTKNFDDGKVWVGRSESNCYDWDGERPQQGDLFKKLGHTRAEVEENQHKVTRYLLKSDFADRYWGIDGYWWDRCGTQPIPPGAIEASQASGIAP